MVSLTTLHESRAGLPVSDVGCARVLAVGTGEGSSLGHLLSEGEGRQVYVRCCRGAVTVGEEPLKVGDAFLWSPGVPVRVEKPPIQAIAVVATPVGGAAAGPVGAAGPGGGAAPGAAAAAPGTVFRRGDALAGLLDDVAVAWLSGDDGVLAARVAEFLRRAWGEEEPARRAARRGVAYGARDAMGASLAEPLTIPELACACRTSPTVLKEAFRDEFGVPVYEWYRRLRMLRASELLGAGAAAIGNVAAQVGYSNASKFARAFTDCMGVSPSAYRAT